MDETLTISCDDCVMRATPACRDCVVTYLCGDTPLFSSPIVARRAPVVLAQDERRALRLLHEAGMAPDLLHRPRRAGGAA